MKKLYTAIWILFIMSTFTLIIMINSTSISINLGFIPYIIIHTIYFIAGLLLSIYIWFKNKDINKFLKEIIIQTIIFGIGIFIADEVGFDNQFFVYQIMFIIMVTISHKNILKLK